jgi:hypothetical protein
MTTPPTIGAVLRGGPDSSLAMPTYGPTPRLRSTNPMALDRPQMFFGLSKN